MEMGRALKRVELPFSCNETYVVAGRARYRCRKRKGHVGPHADTREIILATWTDKGGRAHMDWPWLLLRLWEAKEFWKWRGRITRKQS
jgi:hypothetical protein